MDIFKGNIRPVSLTICGYKLKRNKMFIRMKRLIDEDSISEEYTPSIDLIITTSKPLLINSLPSQRIHCEINIWTNKNVFC